MANEILEMNEAVSRLSANQRAELQEKKPAEGPAAEPEYDDEQRLILGAQPSDETFELEVDGEMVKVPVSQLPEQYRTPAAAPPAFVPTAATPSPASGASQRLGELDQAIQDLNGKLKRPSPPSRTLAREEPEEFNIQVAEFNASQMEYDDNRRTMEQLQTRRSQEATNYQAEVLAVEQNKLAAAWPEWGNPATRQTVAGKLQEYALRQNYSPQEAAMIAAGQVDHRLALSLRDAMRAEILAAKPKRRQARGNAPKVGDPGVRSEKGQSSQKRRDFLRHGDKEGLSMQDGVDFLSGRYSQK